MSYAPIDIRRLVLSLAVLFPLSVVAETRIWPGAAPCHATLEICLGAAADGDTVQMRSNAEIDADVLILKPLRLVAADGFRPSLAAGRNLYAISNRTDDREVLIEGLRVRDGIVRVLVTGSGHAHVVLRRLIVNGDSIQGGPLQVLAFEDASVSYDIGENQLSTVSTQNGIEVDPFNRNPMSGSVHDNRIDIRATHVSDPSGSVWGGAGINVRMDVGSDTRIYSNRIRGGLLYGIVTDGFTNGSSAKSVIANNALQDLGVDGYGIRMAMFEPGTIDTLLINNSITGFEYGLFLSGTEISAELINNLIAFNWRQGMFIQGSNLSNTYTLYYSNGGPTPALGEGSITADPRLRRGLQDIRLAADSPAIGAGNTAALQQLRSGRQIPFLDADGLRRIKTVGGNPAVDIGAYELGDVSLIHKVNATNTLEDASRIDADSLDGQPLQNALITASLAPDTYRAAPNPVWTGVDYVDDHHRIVNESGSTPNAGAAFHVFVPAPGSGNLRHMTSASGGANESPFNLIPLDGRFDAFLLQHIAEPAELFNHGVGVFSAIAFNFLAGDLRTLDLAPFLPNLDFALYAQEPSYTAFHVIQAASGPTAPLSHPLLDGQPCARAFASPASATSNPTPHALDYERASGRWVLRNLDGSAIPTSARFAILIDEAATEQCRYDHVFHDGHEPD